MVTRPIFAKVINKFPLSSKKNKGNNYSLYVITILFFLFCLLFTGIYKKDILFRIQEFSIFLPGKEFIKPYLEIPGGLLKYAAYYLIQFFYHPWLGCTILASLLIVLQILTYKAFNIPKKFYFLSFLPPTFILLSILKLDYIIFKMSGNEYIYSQLIGFICSLFILYFYCFTKTIKSKILYCGLITILLYPILGFFALGGIILCLCKDYKTLLERRKILFLIIAFLFLIPLLYYYFIYFSLNSNYIYTSGLLLSQHYSYSPGIWYMILSILICFVCYAFSPFKRINENNKTKENPLVNSILVFILCIITVVFTNHDKNLKNILLLDKWTKEQNWESIVQQARKKEIVPTPVESLYYNLGLWKEGYLCEEMFDYTNNTLFFMSGYRLVDIVGSQLYFQYGRMNYCYRWAIESMTINGLTIDNLIYMIKSSLVNGEKELAEKYIRTLHKTKFYKEDAQRFYNYLKRPELMEKDTEFVEAMELMHYQDILGEESTFLETCLLNNFKNIEVGNPSELELCMSAILSLKGDRNFWAKSMEYTNNNLLLPRYVQEAIVLFGHDNQQVNINYFPIQNNIKTRFKQFLQARETYKNIENEKASSLMKEQYGDTYWYYYFYINKPTTR